MCLFLFLDTWVVWETGTIIIRTASPKCNVAGVYKDGIRLVWLASGMNMIKKKVTYILFSFFIVRKEKNLDFKFLLENEVRRDLTKLQN